MNKIHLMLGTGIKLSVRLLIGLSSACIYVLFPLVPSPLGASLSPVAQEQAAAYVLYVAPSGSPDNSGTKDYPLDSLLTACKRVDFRRATPHTIYVRGGKYVRQKITWTQANSDGGEPDTCANPNSTSDIYPLTIRAYKNEKPVFDGQGSAWLLNFLLHPGKCTNVTIQGLTIRRYVMVGIQFSGNADDPSKWNGCNKIIGNTFEEIGNLYRTGLCPDCMGYAAIDLQNSDRNIIRNNVLVHLENTPEDASHIHAVYFAHNSSDNIVGDNYISMTSGDPMRVRDGSNDNYIYGNYVDRSGKYGFISGCCNLSDEEPSSGNIITYNTVTFPYPLFSSIELICQSDPCDVGSTFIDYGQRAFEGSRPDREEVGAIAAGDFNGDGKSELAVAFNYDNFTKVVRTTGGRDRHLQKVLYVSRDNAIHEFATGDFDDSGKDQILTYFRHRVTGATEIYRGNGTSSLTDHGLIYSSTNWKISAMTGGDFDGDGRSEVIAALSSFSAGNRLYHGDGTSSVINLGQIYTGTGWYFPALTAGDFDEDGKDELVSAFQNSQQTRIYRGDGTSSAINHGLVYSSKIWEVPALTADFFNGGSVPHLVTAFKHRDSYETRLYTGNGVTSATSTLIYSNTAWRVSALAAGNFDTDSLEELATAFTWPTRNQIWASDGTSSATNQKIFHRWSAPLRFWP
jgi:hypothetical protein